MMEQSPIVLKFVANLKLRHPNATTHDLAQIFSQAMNLPENKEVSRACIADVFNFECRRLEAEERREQFKIVANNGGVKGGADGD